MKKSKLRITGLCAGKSPGTGEFPAQMASNAENVSIWWRHHDAERSMRQDFFGINVRHYLTNEDICDTYHDHTVINRIIDGLTHVWEGKISAINLVVNMFYLQSENSCWSIMYNVKILHIECGTLWWKLWRQSNNDIVESKWTLPASDGPHVGPMNLAIREPKGKLEFNTWCHHPRRQ